MRTKEEIEDKINELYKLAYESKRSISRVVIEADALSWVLGEDYLNTKIITGEQEEHDKT